MEVNQAFSFQGDGARNSAKLLTELVNEGIRLLVYAGNAGMSLSVHSDPLPLTRANERFNVQLSRAREMGD